MEQSPPAGVRLSLDLADPSAVPYFMWDEPVTVTEIRRRLASAERPERTRLLAKILREARDPDVWRFTSPAEVEAAWPTLAPHLGRRRSFWQFVLTRWKELGLLDQDYRRLLVSGRGESLIVDLVFERAPQIHTEKLAIGAIRVDPVDEIFANKLCALLGRAEIRDLVDLFVLEREGLSLEQGLAAGQRKDGGLTPAQLAWVLSQMALSESEAIPGGVPRDDLDRYRRGLIDRLLVLARPSMDGDPGD
jgi:hypothetical protein